MNGMRVNKLYREVRSDSNGGHAAGLPLNNSAQYFPTAVRVVPLSPSVVRPSKDYTYYRMLLETCSPKRIHLRISIELSNT